MYFRDVLVNAHTHTHTPQECFIFYGKTTGLSIKRANVSDVTDMIDRLLLKPKRVLIMFTGADS